jgi:NAD(P)-dependent dehydrogenase (short-subunit alcohol dehydrogenase family)
VLSFIQTLDAEYRQDGVRANAILPSVIDTPANREAQPKADFGKWVEAGGDRQGGALPDLRGFGPTSGAAVPVYGRA